MFVYKRDGSKQELLAAKVEERIKRLCVLREPHVSDSIALDVFKHVTQGLVSGVHTRDLDVLGAQYSNDCKLRHPSYDILASRFLVSSLHKETNPSFSKTFALLGQRGLVAPYYAIIVAAHASLFDARIVHDRDYNFNYFGICTLMRQFYLKQVDKVILERPQYMFMRVALDLHGEDLEGVFACYEKLSRHQISHATPTLLNACSKRAQKASCFLLTLKEDSIDGIFETLSNCAKISKYGGGVGLNIHDLRASGTYIAGTDGHSNGIVKMLKVFEQTAIYVDQGGGKRKGSFAIYLEPWHLEIEAFLDLKLPHGKPELLAKELFYGLWIPDLFMKRVKERGKWTLFCPHKAPGLANVWGDEFEQLYEHYETAGVGSKEVDAEWLATRIVQTQINTGGPFLLFKDRCNALSNQRNLGTIRNSNLCCEIIEYSSPEEIAVCNIAAINLKEHVVDGIFDFDLLKESVQALVVNLNNSIDNCFYAVPEAAVSNSRHRPIGIGVAGLADAFMMLKIPFDSSEGKMMNSLIFEAIYYWALSASCDLAEKYGPYETFQDSPLAKGQLHIDHWPNAVLTLDWESLRARIMLIGVINSLLVALMPTASTAHILGVYESFEVNRKSRKLISSP